MVSVKFNFEGESAHAAGASWKGRSALDAVELMNIAWNFHREHMEPTQRSHYVIPDGGDQPNVVPSKASVWYYFRERTYPKILQMYKDSIKMAEAAAKMTIQKWLTKFWGVHGRDTLKNRWQRLCNKISRLLVYQNEVKTTRHWHVVYKKN